jgi:D-alanyl-D-alanine carboxypeptidase
MNNYAQELGLRSTNFRNPHGLSNFQAFSTAFDIAHLSYHALKNQLIKEIVVT